MEKEEALFRKTHADYETNIIFYDAGGFKFYRKILVTTNKSES